MKGLRPIQENIRHFCQEADRLILKNAPRQIAATLANIPWKILTFEGGELPYPHTHGDVIFLPRRRDLVLRVPVFVHEKIHVFQKLYPDWTFRLLGRPYIVGKHNEHTFVPRNPDVNLYKYEGVEATDVFFESHPLEHMAYGLTEKICS